MTFLHNEEEKFMGITEEQKFVAKHVIVNK